MPCFEVSNIQMFHGLGGLSLKRFTKSTEKDNSPKPIWIRMPKRPTMLQLLLSESSAECGRYILNKIVKELLNLSDIVRFKVENGNGRNDINNQRSMYL